MNWTGNNSKRLIIDNGSHNIIFGNSCIDYPKAVFPNIKGI